MALGVFQEVRGVLGLELVDAEGQRGLFIVEGDGRLARAHPRRREGAHLLNQRLQRGLQLYVLQRRRLRGEEFALLPDRGVEVALVAEAPAVVVVLRWVAVRGLDRFGSLAAGECVAATAREMNTIDLIITQIPKT